MGYRIFWLRTARREFSGLPGQVQRRILPAIENLADDPRPTGCEPVRGIAGGYRIRIGQYRVLYQVRESVITVVVARVLARSAAYERMRDLRTQLRNLRFGGSS